MSGFAATARPIRVLLKERLIRILQIHREAVTEGFVRQSPKQILKALVESVFAQAESTFRCKIEVDFVPSVRLTVVLILLLLSKSVCLPSPFRICAQQRTEPRLLAGVEGADLFEPKRSPVVVHSELYRIVLGSFGRVVPLPRASSDYVALSFEVGIQATPARNSAPRAKPTPSQFASGCALDWLTCLFLSVPPKSATVRVGRLTQ
jgi:hypothetical protein